MNTGALAFEKVRISRGSFVLDLDIVFRKGLLTVVLGPSGCGKTTLLDLAAGFLKPESGRILEDEMDITPMAPERRHVGMVFQENALFPHMNVLGNVVFGPRSRGVPRGEALRTARRHLDLVRMSGYERRRPETLSGGQRQRIAIARALAIHPRILLMDEPFNSLDAALRSTLAAEVRRIQRETGITMILVTHDQQEALSLADVLVVMDRGRIAAVGSPYSLWTDPGDLYTAVFLGRSSRLQVNRVERPDEGAVRVLTSAGVIELPRSHEPPSLSSTLVVRPEGAMIDPDGPLSARVSVVEFRGGAWRIIAVTDESGDLLDFDYVGDKPPAEGRTVQFSLNPEMVRIYPGTVPHSGEPAGQWAMPAAAVRA